MTTFITLTAIIVYLGLGTLLIIKDFTSKYHRPIPMYVANLKAGRDKALSCLIGIIKLFLWPIVFVIKYI